MLTMYEFKKQHSGFSEYEDNFIAAAALKFYTNSNIAVCVEKLLFLGVQALQSLCTLDAIDKFRDYLHDIRQYQ